MTAYILYSSLDFLSLSIWTLSATSSIWSKRAFFSLVSGFEATFYSIIILSPLELRAASDPE